MLKEFREFVMRGNVIDMAVGIVIGLAFGRIITSFVNDVLMPPIGLLLGKMDFTNLFVVLTGSRQPTLAATKAGGAVAISYGMFLNAVIDFVIVAFVIFLVVKMVNRLRRETPNTKKCEYCLSVIPLDATRCPNCTSELKAA